jgi:hypothetical protein
VRTWPGSCGKLGVECRIEVVHGVLGVVVHLAGRLQHAQVPDFVETCAKVGKPLRIDLTELISADAVGIEALLRVREMGAVLDGVPEYLHLKIESLARERPPRPVLAYRAKEKRTSAEPGERKKGDDE